MDRRRQQPRAAGVTRGDDPGSDERTTFTSRLYLDAESYLPISEETDESLDYGEPVPLKSESLYQHEQIPVAEIPADFFDSASIGYSEPDLPGRLDDPSLDITVYWLGEQHGESAGLPAIVLSGVQIPTPDRGPGYQIVLDYSATGDAGRVADRPGSTRAGHDRSIR